MNEKSWLILRIVACLYVIYQGIQLVRGMLTDKPENMVIMMTVGIFFIVVGAAIVIFSLKDLKKLNKRMAEEAELAEESEDEMEQEGAESVPTGDEVESDTDIHREVSLDIKEEREETESEEK